MQDIGYVERLTWTCYAASTSFPQLTGGSARRLRYGRGRGLVQLVVVRRTRVKLGDETAADMADSQPRTGETAVVPRMEETGLARAML
jgi:hypothetical protein